MNEILISLVMRGNIQKPIFGKNCFDHDWFYFDSEKKMHICYLCNEVFFYSNFTYDWYNISSLKIEYMPEIINHGINHLKENNLLAFL